MALPIPAFERYRIELRLTRPAKFPFEHGGVLRGLLSRALERHEFPTGFLPFPCESGHTRFAAGEPYAIGVTLVGDARTLAEELPAALERAGRARVGHPAPVLGGNFTVERVERLEPPDPDANVEALNRASLTELRFLSPLRLERPAELKRRGGGYLDRECFPVGFFLDRLWRRVFFVSKGRYPERGERLSRQPPVPAGAVATPERLVWSDLPVRGAKKKGRAFTLGGVRGTLTVEGLHEDWIPVLVAGSYFHVGSSTAYGFGRYALAGTAGATEGFSRPARTFLDRVSDLSRLGRISRALVKEGSGVPLADLGYELVQGTYRPPIADDEQVLLRDEIVRRAAAEALGSSIDALVEETSDAYRRGHSPLSSAHAVKRAYAQGYTYVCDSGLQAMAGRVDWDVVLMKLEAFYPREPLLELLSAWIRNQQGRPRRCPLLPLLARLGLDTFGDGLSARGLRLVRLEDDFVVLARDPESARASDHPLRQ